MGAAVSVPVHADMKAWIELFNDLNLDVDLNALENAFRDNKFEIFKDVLSNILNNLTFKDLVKVKTKMTLNQALDVGGIGNGAPDAMVAIVGIVGLVITFVFANATNASAMNMLTIALSIAAVAVPFLLYFKQNKPQSLALVDPRPAPIDASVQNSSIVQRLADESKMPHLTHEQQQLAKSLVSSRHDHFIVTGCKFIVDSLVAKKDSKEDLSYLTKSETNDSLTKEEAQQRVSQNIDTLQNAIYKCDMANLDRKNQFCAVAVFQKRIGLMSKRWIADLKRMESNYGQLLSRIKCSFMMPDDFAVSKSAAKQRDNLYDKIHDQTQKLQDKLGEMTEISEDPNQKVTTKFTLDAARTMSQCIVFSSSMDALEKKKLQEDVRSVDTLFRRRTDASDALVSHNASKLNMEQTLQQEESALTRQLGYVTAELDAVESMANKKGNSVWNLTGSPNDPQSRALQKAWDAGQSHKFKHYTSNVDGVSFSLTLMSKDENIAMHVKQMKADCERRIKNLNDEAKPSINQLKEDIAKNKSLRKSFQELLGKATKAYRDAEAKLHKGLTMLSPAHKAQMIGIQRISEAMSQSVKTFLPCRPELDNIEGMLGELLAMTEAPKTYGSLKQVLETAMRLNMQVTDTEASGSVFLKNLGEESITSFLLPAVDPGQPGFLEGSDPGQAEMLAIQREMEQTTTVD